MTRSIHGSTRAIGGIFGFGRPPGSPPGLVRPPGQAAGQGPGLTTPQTGTDPKVAPGAAGASTSALTINPAAQGVPATRTAAGAEGSFTTTTVTFPKSARPTTVQVGVSASSALVQVASIGAYTVAGMAIANQPPVSLDVSFLPEQTSIGVQTQAAAATVISIVANFA